MTAVLPPAAREKLVKMLGLLGSDQPGERDAAGLAAERLVRQHNLTWSELLTPPRTTHKEPLQSVWRSVCAELIKRPGCLRLWERKFVSDLPNFKRLSSKQRYVLYEIADRVGVARGGPV